MFILSLLCIMSVAAAPLSIALGTIDVNDVTSLDIGEGATALDVEPTSTSTGNPIAAAAFPTVVVDDSDATPIPDTLPIFDFPFAKI
ncbi:hypothetical protein C8R46DRAFT_432102 [Mycena filopes]|nr:hypothetical protein C8R46DRAFT_432102 [Mycena filopes]